MAAEAGTRVSPLELFFDLIFVFTITQLASILEHDASWHGVAQAGVELPVIFWMYGGFAWLTNALRADLHRQRTALLLGMAAFFVVSLSVPRAFGDDGPTFGYAYLALNVVHLGCFLFLAPNATFGAMLRVGAGNLVAAGLILAAGYTHGGAHWPLWIAAIVVQYVPSLIGTRTRTFDIGVAHFAERHELMIIIVLGESIVSVALGAQEQPVDLKLIVGALCGLAASAALWWCYFDGESEAAARAMQRRPAGDRGWLALFGYDVPHVFMLGGVIALAAGARLSLPDLLSPTGLAPAAFIAGGAATYLAGLAAFRAVLGYGPPAPRLISAVVAVAAIPVGTHYGAAQELLVLVVVLAGLLLAERRFPVAAA